MSNLDINTIKAILIGVSEYKDKSFINANPIKNNVLYFKNLLLNKDVLGLDENSILVFNENEEHTEILERIDEFVKHEFIDTLIFYFAGHGYKADNGKFYLVTNNTTKKYIGLSSLPWEKIRETFEKGNGIQQRFYILDACHSGTAELGDTETEIEICEGSALLAAAKADAKSYFNESDECTYFTSSLINILENGINEVKQPELPIRPIFQQLDKDLKKHNFEVTIKTTHKIEDVAVFKNRGFDKVEILLKQAKLYFEKGDYEEAEKGFQSAAMTYIKTKKIDQKKIDFINSKMELAHLHNEIKTKLYINYKKQQDETLAGLDKKINQLQNELKEKNKKIETIQAALEEKVAQEKEVRKLKSELTKEKRKNKDLISKKSSLESQIRQVKNELNSAKQKNEILDNKLKSNLPKTPKPDYTRFFSDVHKKNVETKRSTPIITGQFIDTRDNTKYKTVVVGEKTWMATRLSYKQLPNINFLERPVFPSLRTQNEKNIPKYTYGNAVKACPIGWHLPSKQEFEKLINHFSLNQNLLFEFFPDLAAAGYRLYYKKENYSFWSSLPDHFGSNYSMIINADKKAKIELVPQTNTICVLCVKGAFADLKDLVNFPVRNLR